jgi:hypothetical protein
MLSLEWPATPELQSFDRLPLCTKAESNNVSSHETLTLLNITVYKSIRAQVPSWERDRAHLRHLQREFTSSCCCNAVVLGCHHLCAIHTDEIAAPASGRSLFSAWPMGCEVARAPMRHARRRKMNGGVAPLVRAWRYLLRQYVHAINYHQGCSVPVR